MRCYGSIFDRLVNEAPVTDIGTIGDFGKKGGFKRTADKALISNPGRLQTIQKAWGKSTHDFKLYFAQFTGGAKYAEHGALHPDEQADIERRIGQKLPPPDPNAVNVLFTNNNGDQWRAMTPWIIAHRVGHVLARFGRMNDNDQWNRLERVVFRNLDRLADAHKLDDRHFMPRDNQANQRFGGDLYGHAASVRARQATQNKHKAMAHAYGAMRAAREGNFRNPFEFVMDTIAQYLITGRVYLDDNHREVITGHAWGRPQKSYAQNKEYVDLIKRDFSLEVPDYIDAVIEDAKGQWLVM